MDDFREQIGGLLKKARVQRTLEEILAKLLGFSDQQLELVVKPILGSLEGFGTSDGEMSQEDREHLQCVIGSLEEVNSLVGSGAMSSEIVRQLVSQRRSLIAAAAYLPQTFQKSPLVLGALNLVVRSKRIRIGHDLGGEAIRWREKVGEPVFHNSFTKLLGQYFFLKLTIFCSIVDLSKPKLYLQYFGGQPGLRGFSSPKAEKVFQSACEKWPVQDCYALCPLPDWCADSKGQAFWFKEYTWSEQQQELIRLRRQFPGIIIRFASLSELMFLDFSMRLATAQSPFGIWSYRCEHPENPDSCLAYGGSNDYGAAIRLDEDPRRETPVMPLFILEAKKKEGQ